MTFPNDNANNNNNISFYKEISLKRAEFYNLLKHGIHSVVMAAGSGEKGHLGDKGTFTTNDVVVRQEVKMGLPIRLIW